MKSKIKKLVDEKKQLTFAQLISAIQEADRYFAAQANRAVNMSLTLRNWVIGRHIVEYELHGLDRADYGKKLFIELDKRLKKNGISNCRSRQLYYYTSFYRTYPEIMRSLTAKSKKASPKALKVKKVRSLTAKLQLDPNELIQKLSYTHLEQLIALDDPLQRYFYEIECVRGNWSVRDLKRQIASLYFERTGLSKNKKKLAIMTGNGIQGADAKLNIRDPYLFEFLGIKAKEVMVESALEGALLNKLQEFLLELGHGFCFEASQKRILIDGKHYFVDLVFYHRILKCHILIELKTDEFNHEHLGQLNTYVSWFRKNMIERGDNSPIGILLCTKKDHALAEYALAGMNNKLFVSKYQVELPKKKEIEKFLETTLKEIE